MYQYSCSEMILSQFVCISCDYCAFQCVLFHDMSGPGAIMYYPAIFHINFLYTLLP